MAWYIDTDGKTVLEYKMHSSNSIVLSDGRVLIDSPNIDRRIFATHPDKNTFCRREEDGTISYLETGKPETQRRFFRPPASER